MTAFDFKLLKALHRKGDISANEPENPFRDDLESLDYAQLPVDSILLEFLDSGYFDQGKFESEFPNFAALNAEEDFRKQCLAISNSIWEKFAPLEPQELDRIEQFLDGNYVGRLGPRDLDFYQRILEVHGRIPNRAQRELRWAQRVLLIDLPLLASAEQWLKTEEAKCALRERFDAAQDPGAPQTFKETLDRPLLSLRFLKSIEAGDAEALEQILRTISDPQLIDKLSILLREAQTPTLHSAELSPFLSGFAEALLCALQKLSEENEMNKIRVDLIRSRAQHDV